MCRSRYSRAARFSRGSCLHATSRKSWSVAASTCRCGGSCCRMHRLRSSTICHAIDLQRICLGVRRETFARRGTPGRASAREVRRSGFVADLAAGTAGARDGAPPVDHGGLPASGRVSGRDHDPRARGGMVRQGQRLLSECSPRPSHLRKEPGRFEMHVLSFEEAYDYLERAIRLAEAWAAGSAGPADGIAGAAGRDAPAD